MSTTTTTETAPKRKSKAQKPAEATVVKTATLPPKETAIATVETGPTEISVYDYGDLAGAGFEGQTAEDYSTPFLNVLQIQSPEIENIPEAEVGMFFNTVSQECYSEVEFIPCLMRHHYVMFRHKDDGGGFRGIFALDAPEVTSVLQAIEEKGGTPYGKLDSKRVFLDEKGQEQTERVQLVETYEHCGILIADGNVIGGAIVPYTSAKITNFKKFNGRLRDFCNRTKAPMFAVVLKLTTSTKKFTKGSAYITNLEPSGGSWDTARLARDDDRFTMALAFHKLLLAGEVKADYNRVDESETRATDGEDAPF